MNENVIQLCRFDGCRRAASYPGQARCDEHRLRWGADQPAERETFVPEWRRRDLTKDMTGSAA